MFREFASSKLSTLCALSYPLFPALSIMSTLSWCCCLFSNCNFVLIVHIFKRLTNVHNLCSNYCHVFAQLSYFLQRLQCHKNASDQTKLRCLFGPACMSVCVSATERHSRGAGATDNSQPLSDITATTYEPLNENTQRPVNYEQLPSQTGQQQDYYNVQQHDYYNVSNPSNVNTASPYEELNINTQRPPIYDQLNHGYS